MDELQQAKTVHPLPVQYMVDVDVKLNKSSSSANIAEMTIRKPVRDNDEESMCSQEKPEIRHSVYNVPEKYIIVLLGGFSGFWSSISSPIYLPVLPTLQKTFSVNEEQMNITVVVYSIFQGLAPVIFSNLSDKLGRRPIILMCLVIYVLANVGLALNTTFTGLVLLRCLQAFGISSTLSVASGVASDITSRSERASFIGLSTGLSLLGQAFGALIGGMISSGFGWRGIFWFLAICAGVTLMIDWVFLPETSRILVGNGSSLPEKYQWLSVAPILHLQTFERRRVGYNPTLVKGQKFNMLAPFKILTNTPVFLTLIPASLCYALWLMMLTTLSTSLSGTYGYTMSQIAVAYVPSGLGGLAGSVTIGELLDWSYRKNYKRYQKRNNLDKRRFNILKSRLAMAALPTILAVSGSFLFGWCLYYKQSVVAVLVASFTISFAAMNYLTISTTVLIDLYPTQLCGSSGCVNLTRCWVAAIFIAGLSKMVATMTVAGCYSFMGALCGISGLCVGYVYVESNRWLN